MRLGARTLLCSVVWRDRTKAWSRRTSASGRPRTPPARPGSGPRVERSTTTRASGDSQPWSRRASRAATTSSTGTAYGGSRKARSYGARGLWASARPTGRSTTSMPVKPSERAFSRISAAVRRSCSTSVTTPAPRDRASRPTAPLPAYTSRKRSPLIDPTAASTAENSASRTRSEVGRVLSPVGVLIRRPPALPPMIRVMPSPGSRPGRRRGAGAPAGPGRGGWPASGRRRRPGRPPRGPRR